MNSPWGCSIGGRNVSAKVSAMSTSCHVGRVALVTAVTKRTAGLHSKLHCRSNHVSGTAASAEIIPQELRHWTYAAPKNMRWNDASSWELERQACAKRGSRQ